MGPSGLTLLMSKVGAIRNVGAFFSANREGIMSKLDPKTLTVFCRRLQKPLSIKDHEACPYCWGERGEIQEGEHDHFCDFKPGEDPTAFGDDSGSDRMTRG
jgi:hypothetical protein